MRSNMNIKKNTKVFVAGCGGMLGQAVYEKFTPHCQVLATDIDINEPWLDYGDVIDYQKISEKVFKFNPEIIINLAALTDLEYCEKNPELTWQTNALGAENMALIAKKLDAIYVYISTAGIFDGKQEYYNDFDIPNPLSIYAKAKYYGELTTERMLNKYFIFRAGWMMGGGLEKDKKFINKIFKIIMKGNQELYIVKDKLGTPTYTKDFSYSMFKIVQTELYGLYNMVCNGSCSRFDVAVEFIRLLGLESKIDIHIVGSDYYKNEYFAPRPQSEKLVNLKLNSRKINYMQHWKKCLSEYSIHYKNILLKRKII